MDDDQTSRIKTLDWEQASRSYTTIITTSNPEQLQIEATLHLARLANHAPIPILASLLPILVGLLVAAPRPNLQRAAAHALTRLARRPHNTTTLCPTIAQLGAIPSILTLLLLPTTTTSNPAFRRTLLRCLSALIASHNPNRIILARNGGLEIILNLISAPAPAPNDHKRYLLEILSALALLREVRRVVVAHGGLPFLVEALTYGKLFSRTQAAQAIGLLGHNKKVRHLLVELSAIPALVKLMRDGDASARLTSGNALGVVSSHVAYLPLVAQAGAIPLYAEMLEGTEPMGREIAEDVFCVLAVAEENAVVIIDHLVRILRGNDEEAKAAAIDVLWDLSGYKHSVSIMRESGAIRLLLELLRDGNGDLRVNASAAVAQLSYDGGNRRAMVEEGVIPVLFHLLTGNSEELREYAVEAVINFTEDLQFRERVSRAFEIGSFLEIQERLRRIRTTDEYMVRFMRMMSVEHLTSHPDLI